MQTHNNAPFVASIKRQLEQQYNADVLRFESVFADYEILLRRAHELHVRNQQLTKESNELRLENDETRAQLEAVQTSAAPRAEVIALESALARARQELSESQKTQLSLSKQLLQKKDELSTAQDVNEEKEKQLTDLRVLTESLQQQTSTAEVRAQEASAAAELAQEEIVRRRDEGEALHARVQHLEREANDLANRMREMRDTELQRIDEVNKHCEEMLTNARLKEQQAQRLLDSAMLQHQAAQGPAQGPGIPSGDAAAAAANPLAPVGQQLVGSLRSLFGRGRTPSGRSSSQGGEAAEAPPAVDAHHGLQQSVLDAMLAPLTTGSMADATPPTRASKTVVAHAGGCYGIAFDRNGSRMATCGADRAVKLWEPTHGSHTATLQGSAETVLGVCFTCDARYVLGSGKDIRMWDITSGRERHVLTGHAAKVVAVAASQVDPTRAASVSEDRTIKVWDLKHGRQVHTVLIGSGGTAITMTRDGAVLVSGHMDGALRLWDVRSGNKAQDLAALHKGALTSVDVGLSGRLLVTCAKDSTLAVVDTRMWEVVGRLQAPGFAVAGKHTKACFAPNEAYVAAGSSDGSVFVWAVDVPAREGSKATAPQQLERGSHKDVPVVCTAWSPVFAPLVSSDAKGGLVFWD